MHRLFLTFSLAILALASVLSGCDQAKQPAAGLAQVKDDGKVPPGEAKPIPPGEAKPIPTDEARDPDAPAVETKTDPDLLPVLPQLAAPTGEDKYEAALGKAFLLMAEKKDAEALASLKEAQAAKETDFVRTEIERLDARIARNESAQKAADDIREVLDNGLPTDAARLAGEALAQYGDSDLADKLTALKRQADALVGAGLEEKPRQQRFLDEAETARKANNLRTAVVSYEQAVANGAEPGELKTTYASLRLKLATYDAQRTKAAELRKDPNQFEQAVAALKVAAESWDTPQIRQEISEVELALAKRKDRVAIADFEVINDIGVANAGHAIAEELLGHMRPRYDVVEQTQVRNLMAALKLDTNNFADDDETRAEFGKVVNARYVVLGSVNRLVGIHVNARLVDTQTGLIVQTARIAAATPAEMTSRLPALARMLQMTDEEKRSYERELAEQARPVAPPAATAELPPPPVVDVAPPIPPAPIVMFTPRPPEFGRVVVADFGNFRFVAAAVAPPPPIVVVDAPVLVRDRAFFVAIEVGDNCFRRGLFREALRHFEFALSINPGHAAIRLRVMQCRPLCPPPVVVVPVIRPRLVVLPFAEFRDPFAVPSAIPPGLGLWTADAIAPYLHGRFDVVDKCELYWWMGRLGLSIRDVLTNPHARLCLGRALGARFFLMGSLHEIASFDASTHLIDAELNVQTHGARIRVQNAAELRFRLGELTNLMFVPPQQQVVIVQQQQVVQRKVVAAQLEIKKGNFSLALGFYKEVLVANPHHVEARSFVLQLDFRTRQREMEAARIAAFQQQQAALQAQRDQQIALATATEAVRLQAQRDAAKNKQLMAQQQLIAQQNLLNQALLAQRQNDLERRVALLESANGIRRDDKILEQLAEAKAELAAERQKRRAAEQALRDRQQQKANDAQILKLTPQLVAQKQRLEARQKAEVGRVQAEYDRFLDQGQKAMAAQKYPLAVTSYQNARRLKPSAEIEKLVSTALVEQARADAEARGASEKRKLEVELAQEEKERGQLEIKNARLRAKYQAALANAQDAMKARQFQQAATSYRVALTSMQTDEATNGLRLAEVELAKANSAADEEAKSARKKAATDKYLTTGRAALAARQFDKAQAAFRAAANLQPGDVAIQKLLTDAESAQEQALAAERKKKESDQLQATLRRLVAAGELNLKARQFDAAIVAFSDALKIEPENKSAQSGLQQAQAAAATVNATAAAQADAKRKRETYELAMRKGRAALSLKQFAEAITHFKMAQQTLPGDVASTELLTEATKRKTDADSAGLAQRKAAELNQSLLAGRAALRALHFDDAQAAADRAAKLDADSAAVRKLIADISEAKSAYMAQVQKKEAQAKKSAQVDALLDKARSALHEKELTQAAKYIADALALDATDPDIKKVQAEFNAVQRGIAAAKTSDAKDSAYDAAMKSARTAFAAGKFEEAIASAGDALKYKPGDAAATQLLTAARRADKSADATAMEAKKKQDAYQLALRNASSAFTLKKYDVAIKEAKEALANKPGDAAATSLLADSQQALDAVNAAAMAAQKEKEAYDAAMKIGRAALTRKDYPAAERAFLEALRADAGDPSATTLLKQARDGIADAGEMAKRKTLYDQWMNRAKTLMATKDYDDAVTAYQNALKIVPGDAAATAGLAAARTALNAKKDPPPVPKPKDPPKSDPKPKGDPNAARIAALFKSAAAEEKAGKYAEAFQTYQDILKLAPAHVDAKKQSTFCQWMDQGQKQLAAGKLSDAAVSFEQALKIDPTDANAQRLLAQTKPKPKPKKK